MQIMTVLLHFVTLPNFINYAEGNNKIPSY